MSFDLRRRIEEFEIDGPVSPALPFAARLAREQGWSRAFADRVVREYKRFAYLAMTAGRPVCPSEQVDAAWHLHLTFTRSYWQRFCGDVLGQPLHHDPTRGGPAESDKHLRMYDETFAAYREAFGEAPPVDIWPPAVDRFGDDARQVVVNTARNWVIPKASVKRVTAGLAVAVVAVVFATGCVGGLDPFELKGAEYLAFLIPVLVAAIPIGMVLRNLMKRTAAESSPETPDLSWDEAAVLAGGSDRLLSTAITKLTRDGQVRVSADRKFLEQVGPVPSDLSGVESDILDALPLDRGNKTDLKNLRTRVTVRASGITERLTEAGLMLAPGRSWAACLATAVPLALVILLFGVTRLIAGLANDKPVGFLVGTLVVAGIALLIIVSKLPTRSTRGDALLKQFQQRHALLKHARTRETDESLPLAVALFGTAVLIGSDEYAGLHQWYPRQQTDGSGSGCGTGCSTVSGDGGGGGDGGGSGCGGCGGGGGD